VQPGHANSITWAKAIYVRSDLVDHPDNLVAGDERQSRQIQLPLHCVQIGVTHSTAVDSDTDLIWAWSGIRQLQCDQGAFLR